MQALVQQAPPVNGFLAGWMYLAFEMLADIAHRVVQGMQASIQFPTEAAIVAVQARMSIRTSAEGIHDACLYFMDIAG